MIIVPNFKNRSKLHFAEEVKNKFSFLLSLGFSCVESVMTFVRFESSKHAINVYHGQQSYEIGLDIEFLKLGKSYSISQVLKLDRYNKVAAWSHPTVTTLDNIVNRIDQLACLLQKSIDFGILDDDNLSSDLRRQEEEWAIEYTNKIELRQAHEESNLAWRKKDFARFIEILEPLRKNLGPVDLRKLEYAVKKINS